MASLHATRPALFATTLPLGDTPNESACATLRAFGDSVAAESGSVVAFCDKARAFHDKSCVKLGRGRRLRSTTPPRQQAHGGHIFSTANTTHPWLQGGHVPYESRVTQWQVNAVLAAYSRDDSSHPVTQTSTGPVIRATYLISVGKPNPASKSVFRLYEAQKQQSPRHCLRLSC